MNTSRLADLARGQTSVAKKVLDAVPISEPWALTQIASELLRQGHRMERRILEGCLLTLKESGLVREPTRGAFIRVTARPRVEIGVVAAVAPEVETPTVPAKGSAMDRLAGLAADLRALASLASALATRIDDVAVEVEDEMQKLRDQGANLRKLKALLNSVEAD